MSSTLVLALMEAIAAATTGIPKDAKAASNRLSSGMPIQIEVARGYAAGDDGVVTVYGVDLPNPNLEGSASTGQGRVAQGTGAATVFDTDIPYTAFSNYNWICRVNGVILEQGAGAGKFQVSDNAGNARITFGTAPVLGAKVEIFRVTPVVVMAATGAGVAHKHAQAVSKDVLWATLAGATFGATNVYVKPLAA